MKKTICILAILTLLPTLAFAEWRIEPRSPDFTPGDGFMDAGTIYNPYVLKDSYGNQRATIKARSLDFTPNDGFMDAGTIYNPYIIDWEYDEDED